MTVVRIAVPAIPVGGGVVAEADGTRVLLCRSAAGLHAIGELCPHQSLSMEGARVRGASIICPHHGARFSLADGHSLSPLTHRPITLFAFRQDGDDVEIELPAAGS